MARKWRQMASYSEADQSVRGAGSFSSSLALVSSSRSSPLRNRPDVEPGAAGGGGGDRTELVSAGSSTLSTWDPYDPIPAISDTSRKNLAAFFACDGELLTRK